MGIIIGSARADENYKYSGGRRGDQRQKSSYDTTGEVSLQSFYVHSKGWYVLRPKSIKYADAIAKEMKDACNNKHFGYSQSDRYSVISYKTTANAKINNDVNCDCSSLVRKCILSATGKDVGDFNTVNEATTLEKSGLFENRKEYRDGMQLFDGDVLVTKTKGHTVIVVSGNPRVEQKKEVNTGSTKKVNYTIGIKYTVKTSGLNMRNKPNKTGDVIMSLKKGDNFTCKQVKKVNDAIWISNGAGWACGINSNGEVYIG